MSFSLSGAIALVLRLLRKGYDTMQRNETIVLIIARLQRNENIRQAMQILESSVPFQLTSIKHFFSTLINIGPFGIGSIVSTLIIVVDSNHILLHIYSF